jgi:hypothetical protein
VCILRSEPALLNNTTLQTATTTASSGEGGVGQWPANGRPRYRGSPDHPPSSQNGGTAPDARRGAWAGQGGGASGACADNYRLGRASLPATNSLSPCVWRAHCTGSTSGTSAGSHRAHRTGLRFRKAGHLRTYNRRRNYLVKPPQRE